MKSQMRSGSAKRWISRMTLFPVICINLDCGSPVGEVCLRDRFGIKQRVIWNRILPNIYSPHKAVLLRADTKYRCFFVLYTIETNVSI